MKIPGTYLHTHDIDWFCKLRDGYIHVASAGGDLPNCINNWQIIKKTTNQVSLLPEIAEVIRNEDVITHIKADLIEKETYYCTFEIMASKGFISIDKSNISDINDRLYHIVCYPKKNNPEDFSSLAVECAECSNVSIDDIPKDKSFDLFNLLEMSNSENVYKE